MSEPFEPSPFMPGVTRDFDTEFNVAPGKQQRGQTDVDASTGLPVHEKEGNIKENNVAKIKVVVCWFFWQRLYLSLSPSARICAYGYGFLHTIQI